MCVCGGGGGGEGRQWEVVVAGKGGKIQVCGGAKTKNATWYGVSQVPNLSRPSSLSQEKVPKRKCRQCGRQRHRQAWLQLHAHAMPANARQGKAADGAKGHGQANEEMKKQREEKGEGRW